MENEIIQVSGGEMLEAINRSEIDGQIATAHKFPRDITQCKQNMVALAAMDDDVAYNCFYHLERKGKDGQVSIIEGPSVRFTEIISACWKNLRIAGRIIANDGKTITAQGVCHDLESNVAYSVEVKRSILTSKGYAFSQDMQVVVGNAAVAIAQRNAICKVVPQVLISSVVKEVQAKALEHIKQTGVKSQWKNCVACFQAYQVTDLMLLDYIRKKSAEEVTAEDIQKLGGVYNAIKEGTTTVEETFKKPKQQEAIAKQAQAAAKAQDPTATARPSIGERYEQAKHQQPAPQQSQDDKFRWVIQQNLDDLKKNPRNKPAKDSLARFYEQGVLQRLGIDWKPEK